MTPLATISEGDICHYPGQIIILVVIYITSISKCENTLQADIFKRHFGVIQLSDCVSERDCAMQDIGFSACFRQFSFQANALST